MTPSFTGGPWTDFDESGSDGSGFPWPQGIRPVRPPPDDIRFLIKYIFDEMNTNG